MKGQVFTVAKLHYINGVVYFVAQKKQHGFVYSGKAPCGNDQKW